MIHFASSRFQVVQCAANANCIAQYVDTGSIVTRRDATRRQLHIVMHEAASVAATARRHISAPAPARLTRLTPSPVTQIFLAAFHSWSLNSIPKK